MSWLFIFTLAAIICAKIVYIVSTEVVVVEQVTASVSTSTPATTVVVQEVVVVNPGPTTGSTGLLSTEKESSTSVIESREALEVEATSKLPQVHHTTGTSEMSIFSGVSTNTKWSSGSKSSHKGSIYDQIANTGADEQYSRTILDAHNAKRYIHHSGNLSWNSTLYYYAQAYAHRYDCSGVLKHSGGPYGENLIAGTDLHTGADAVEAWYSEIRSYNWTTQSQYNHFTAMIWKSTTQVGCAYKNCQKETWGYYTVCSYSEMVPNLVGAAKQNVLPA